MTLPCPTALPAPPDAFVAVAARALDARPVRCLGTGAMGGAYLTDDGDVLKVTHDAFEVAWVRAVLALRAAGLPLPSLVGMDPRGVVDVGARPDPRYGGHLVPWRAYRRAVVARPDLPVATARRIDAMRRSPATGAFPVRAVRALHADPATRALAEDLALAEARGLAIGDVRTGNAGTAPDGTLVLFDARGSTPRRR